jgi:hypothetical protein
MTRAPKHEFSSTPSEVLRYFVVWLHGFHRDREKSKAADWAMVVLTFLTVVAAIASAWLFEAQLKEARRSTDAAIQNFKLDERAWIEIEAINPARVEPHATEKRIAYRYEFRVKNVGKTVASRVFMTLERVSFKDPVGYNEKKILEAIESIGQSAEIGETAEGKVTTALQSSVPRILAPNTSAPVPALIVAYVPIKSASAGLSPIKHDYDYIVGAVYYYDVFQVAHSLSFCYIVSDDQGSLRSCIFGNDEDRIERKAIYDY